MYGRATICFNSTLSTSRLPAALRRESSLEPPRYSPRLSQHQQRGAAQSLPAAPALHFGSNQVGHLLLNINNAVQLRASRPPPRFTSAPTKPATSFSTSTTRRSSKFPGCPRASLRLQSSRPPRLIPYATCLRCTPSRSPEPNCLPESPLSIS